MPSAAVVDASIASLEIVYRKLLLKESVEGPLNSGESEACELVRRALHSLQTLELEVTFKENHPMLARSGSVGRPRFNIPRCQLVFLVENQFTVPQNCLYNQCVCSNNFQKNGGE